MPEISVLPAGSTRTPSTHPVHRATALLQEALHDSRRATFTQEFGEVRGIHRLSAPPSAEVFVDSDAFTDWVSPPAPAVVAGSSLGYSSEDAPGRPVALVEDSTPAPAPHQDGSVIHAADPQLRGLIRDFRERQRKAGLIVAGSIASAATLTVVTIALVFALAA